MEDRYYIASDLCRLYLVYEFDDLRNQLAGYDHDGLLLGQKRGFVFRNLLKPWKGDRQ